MTPSTMPPGDGSSLTEPLMGDSDEEAAGDRENGLLASTATSIEPPASKYTRLPTRDGRIWLRRRGHIHNVHHAILVLHDEDTREYSRNWPDVILRYRRRAVRPGLGEISGEAVSIRDLLPDRGGDDFDRGDALYTLIHLGRDLEVLPAKICGVIMGAVVFVISLLPDLSEAWPVSVVGSVAAFLIVSYALAGSSLWIERCDRSENDYHDGEP
ncbi:hypothetical protein THAOC_15312 [Thalassiosira oceanica]|uniref:Uncharacterized protein n=1 Tax=Thalassiosira oceanica TaxID=159749 RepID=K0SG75_THAOC|nr:hypothetical protein THAOC_15312 [Thalassiosira oceanica]|eukprot:EJK63999.1 hypothetical protein THAOC_15312 [Thalassiosira oceanica]